VVLNLVLNAVDAMGGEGVVTVETSRLGDGETALVAVEDTGPGIPPHIQDKLFDPFFTTKESGKGTGLGLSIVYGVVERHGGKVRVSSPAGLGARFEIELPALCAPPRGATSAAPVTATLLVVDDDALLLRSLAASLHELGFRVLAARGGVEALNTLAAETNSVDAAVVDIRMPSMGGLELAQKLRESRPDLPIVFMTGFSEERDEDLSRLSAVKPFLKPFSPSQLADTLRALLGGKTSECV
jgi:two-component system cell cycle sensor histidine kinase/response regulator CckA